MTFDPLLLGAFALYFASFIGLILAFCAIGLRRKGLFFIRSYVSYLDLLLRLYLDRQAERAFLQPDPPPDPGAAIVAAAAVPIAVALAAAVPGPATAAPAEVDPARQSPQQVVIIISPPAEDVTPEYGMSVPTLYGVIVYSFPQ